MSDYDDRADECAEDDDCGYGADDPQYIEWINAMEAQEHRMRSTPKPEGMQVHTHHGTEGPAHDPYSFTEITVTMPDGREIEYHMGLGEWLMVDGEELMTGIGWGDRERLTRDKFEELVGFPIDQLEWWGDAPYRNSPCMACGRESGCRGRCQE